MDAGNPLPLNGVRVLDLSAVVMGPWATHLLAAQGAEVIKVEAPGGDTMRVADPHGRPGMAPIFQHSNRGKKSVVLDLKRAEGREAALRLAAGADVLVHNIRPAAMARLGLGYGAVREINQRIVYAALTGFGSRGPYAERPAYDDLIQGACGLAAMFEAVDGSPRYVPALVADRYVGVYAAGAITAALLAAWRTGEGRLVEVPMFETMVELVLSDHLGGLSFDPPAGGVGYSRLTNAQRRPYPTRDSYICVILYTERHWAHFFTAIGQEARFRDDARLSDPTLRRASYAYAYGVVADELARRTTAEWLALLQAQDIPAMPLGTVERLLDDPHLEAAGLLGWEGDVRAIGSPLTGRAAGPAPRLGEHTREVLAGAGYTEAEIDALIAANVAAEPEPNASRCAILPE